MGKTTIINQFLTDIQWLQPQLCNFKIAGNVDVWKFVADDNLPQADIFSHLLTTEELARANRFYRQRDRERFIISRGILKYVLGEYTGQDASAMEFGIGENKKPFIKNQGDLKIHYNLSHSEDAILLAVSGSAIGADVEHINPNFSFDDVLEDNFSPTEIAYIKQNDSIDRFFRIWTRKEAVTKATAQGLDVDLRLLPGLDGIQTVDDGIVASDENWKISSFNFNDSYSASIATSHTINKIAFFGIDTLKNPLFLNR